MKKEYLIVKIQKKQACGMAVVFRMTNDFVPVYEEIARIIGEEQTIKLYENFRGQQITFPQRLYSIEYVSKYVKENYNGKNIHEMARKFDYSERRVREFLKN